MQKAFFRAWLSKLKEKIFFSLYSLLYIFALSFVFFREFFKRPIETRKKWIKEKFGFFEILPENKQRIWIHAVSVGETIAITKLVKELSVTHDIILSTITDTGQKVAQDRFRELPVNVIYMPFDIPFVIKNTLKRLKPSAVILTETEIWPNLIRLASEKIPVAVINGRVSEKSFKGYKRIGFFIKDILKKISLICVQDSIYRERFKSLGVEEDKIHVTGNLKFDIELKEIFFQWEDKIPKPVIVAGSTHEPEEELILKSFLKVNKKATLMLAPRHPERFDDVEKIIKKFKNHNNFAFARLSSQEEMNFILKSDQSTNTSLIILVDKIGILGSLYRVCDFAIIGGSFIPHGGQNPLEPAYWKKCFICGPSMYNFPFIDEFIREKACFMVDSEKLWLIINDLIENPHLRNQTGHRAYNVFLTKSGATVRTINLLKTIV